MLIAARFIQGVGGALASAVILGMIVTMFPEPGEQAKAIGVFSFVASAGASIGLLAGGVLTQLLTWHWIFFVNVPIGVAAWVLAARLLEPEDGPRPARGRRRARRRARDRRADARRLHDRRRATRWLLGALAVALLAAFVGARRPPSGRCCGSRSCAHRNVAGANLVADADGRGHARRVLPRRAVPAARARLRRVRAPARRSCRSRCRSACSRSASRRG